MVKLDLENATSGKLKQQRWTVGAPQKDFEQDYKDSFPDTIVGNMDTLLNIINQQKAVDAKRNSRNGWEKPVTF
jgi:hypothetical protein